MSIPRRRPPAVFLLLLLGALLAARSALLAAPPTHATPRGANPAPFAAIDRAVDAAIQEKKIPGAVVIVGHDGRIVFEKAYGMRSLEPTREAMTENTIFDFASLTKPLITATAVMQLYEQGRLRLDDPVASYLPAFAAHEKGKITIRELLTHYSGLAPDLPLAEPWSGEAEGLRRAMAAIPATAPGANFRYSDINYIVLGAVVEKLSGLPLNQYAEEHILGPLGLEHTRFLPPVSWRSQIAPTQYDERGVMLRGVVDDTTARRMGGVAGDAGLFGDAGDVAIFAQQLLDRLAGGFSLFPLKRATLEQMISPAQPSKGYAKRGLGWDIDSPFSSPRGRLFPVGSFGHTGYTGTSLWIDPGSDSYVILLTNSVHPRGHPSLSPLRAEVATATAAALGIEATASVQTGIDVLEADDFSLLAHLARRHGGRLRIGLLTNQTGLDAQGRRTADVLATQAKTAVPGLELKALFSPEHGIHGTLDSTGIANSIDSATGLPVVSLYGATDAERRPPLDTLRQLDAVVIDLQDAGVRFYTYETLVRYFLEASARTGTEIVVLDRPNPLGGEYVQGPLSERGRESYVNAMPIPVRHGMTLGELARYFNGAGKIHAQLTVVRMRNWRRSDWFDETGLRWVNPSPNLRSSQAATLYPALGLLETTNLSVGRGTATPFAFVGAPWIHGPSLARFLNARRIPGVRFVPVSFTPTPPYPYANQLCRGVRPEVTDRDALDTPELGIEIASALHKLYGKQSELAKMDRLLVNRAVLHEILAGRDPRRIALGWRRALGIFEEARRQYLLY